MATDRGRKDVKPPGPAGLLARLVVEVALYPLVPGADEKLGAAKAAALNDGGTPAGGGGRRGSEA